MHPLCVSLVACRLCVEHLGFDEKGACACVAVLFVVFEALPCTRYWYHLSVLMSPVVFLQQIPACRTEQFLRGTKAKAPRCRNQWLFTSPIMRLQGRCRAPVDCAGIREKNAMLYASSSFNGQFFKPKDITFRRILLVLVELVGATVPNRA